MSKQRNSKSAKSNVGKLASDQPQNCDQDQSALREGKDETLSSPATRAQESFSVYYVSLSVVVVLVAGLLAFSVSHRFKNSVTVPTKADTKPKGLVLLTEEELSKHDGSDPNVPVYLSILGRIYDVDKGRQHYEVGSGYNVFAGRDSTPSFVTGEFSREKATDDVKGLSPEEMLGVKEWLDFYRKDYIYVGKLIGRYYDSEGNPTEALKEAKTVIKEGQKLKKLQEAQNKRYPGCNSKWNAEEGSTVWCSQNSGGISRSWVGVPRKMFKPGKKDSKCVCIKTTGPSSDTGEGNDGDLNNPTMKQYVGCGKYDASCKL